MVNSYVPTQVLLDSICSLISLQPAEETRIKNIVQEVLNTIITRIKTKFPLFELIYDSLYLCGSYRDKIKISRPDEFDYNVLFELPEAVIVDENESSETIKIKIDQEKKQANDFEIPEKWIDSEGFLRLQPIQSYFEGLLGKIKITDRPMDIAGHSLLIKLRKNGPAHTLNIKFKDNAMQKFILNIDLVPGVIFNRGKIDECIAIPKPKAGAGNFEDVEFVPSYPRQESFIVRDKQNLKNTLRLVKKIRDRLEVLHLKSYFIKTVFLWVNKHEGPKIWNKSLEELIEKMLGEIVQCLEDRQLWFYWRPKFNMLSKLNNSQIDEMRNQMKAALKQFKKTRNTIALCDLFLSSEEKKKLAMNAGLQKNITD